MASRTISNVKYKTFQFGEVKAKDEQAGHFTGLASVYGVVDYGGDVVVAGAFTDTLTKNGNRCKILSQHMHAKTIGDAVLEDTPEGLRVAEGRLVLDLEDAKQEYIRLKEGLLDGLSIGYHVMPGGESYERGIRKLLKLELHEISLVTFPMNPHSRVDGVKGVDEADPLDVLREAVTQFKRASSLDEKAGRMLSASNLALVKECYTAGTALVERLTALIAAAEGGDDKAKAAAAAEANQTKAALEQLSATLGALKL